MSEKIFQNYVVNTIAEYMMFIFLAIVKAMQRVYKNMLKCISGVIAKGFAIGILCQWGGMAYIVPTFHKYSKIE